MGKQEGWEERKDEGREVQEGRQCPQVETTRKEEKKKGEEFVKGRGALIGFISVR